MTVLILGKPSKTLKAFEPPQFFEDFSYYNSNYIRLFYITFWRAPKTKCESFREMAWGSLKVDWLKIMLFRVKVLYYYVLWLNWIEFL